MSCDKEFWPSIISRPRELFQIYSNGIKRNAANYRKLVNSTFFEKSSVQVKLLYKLRSK